MTEYEVGDPIQVRSLKDLESKYFRDHSGDLFMKDIYFNETMQNYCDRFGVIQKVHSFDRYRLSFDGKYVVNYWNAEMFVGESKEEDNLFSTIDRDTEYKEDLL